MTTSCLWLALLAAQDEKPLRDFEWLAGSWTGHTRYDEKTWIFDAPGEDEGPYRWVLQKMGEDSLCFVGQIRRGDVFVTLLTETLERNP